MDIALTWDLLILTVLVLLAAYSFLLGQNATIKLILSIYIALLSADGVAWAIKKFLFDPSPGFQSLFGENEIIIFAWIRIILFIIGVVVFVVRSGFHVHLDQHDRWLYRFGIHGVFSILSAVLFLSTLLMYISGNSVAEGMAFASQVTIYDDSVIAKIIIDYYQLFFAMPAIAFLITSFFFHSEKKES